MTDLSPVILSHEEHLAEIARGADWTIDRLLRDFFAPDHFEADLEIIRQCMERA